MATRHDSCWYTDSNAVDVHSFSSRSSLRVSHAEIQLSVKFETRTLFGNVTLTLAREPNSDEVLFLDSRNLEILHVLISSDSSTFQPAAYKVHPSDPILGSAVEIRMMASVKFVRIIYATMPNSTAVQWLEPAQTSTKLFPYLFTQSQEIHARSWLPIQDSPAARLTFWAKISVPPHLRAVMGAQLLRADRTEGIYEFGMDLPIPPYLISLAVGRIEFANTGKRTGVFAEPDTLARACKEFGDAERMLGVTEKLYGPYRWGRFDPLVLPPSFPFGGMENPRVPFITSTAIAGDRSLVSLLAHELAHSWSGNLVTNATWADFWVNEGFTTYIQFRIQEELYGRSRANMEAELEEMALSEDISVLDPCDQVLHIDLAGRDPDEGSTLVPYVKGSLFLRTIERWFGRQRLDKFLKKYFEEFAFQSITTETVLEYLQAHLFVEVPSLAEKIPLFEWIASPGLPKGAAKFHCREFKQVKRFARDWVKGVISPPEMPCSKWSAAEWIYFLSSLPRRVSPLRLSGLDEAFGLTASQNSEILSRWLVIAIRSEYSAVFSVLDKFLLDVGRRKYLKPIYSELAASAKTRSYAREIYSRARHHYHPITQRMVEEILDPPHENEKPKRRAG